MALSCAFDRLMRPLLRHLNVSAPTLAENQGLGIQFERMNVQFTPLNQDELLIVAQLGCLPAEQDTARSLLLLAQNNFDQLAPAITLTVQGDDNQILLWSRERFFNLDSVTLLALFERLVDKAHLTVRLISSQQRHVR